MGNTGNPANLQPFVKGDGRASEAGRRSVAARQARRALEVDGTSALRRELDTCISTFERDQLGTAAAAVALQLLAKVAAGVITVKGPDVAALVRVLVDVARLEAGEHTSAALVGHVSTADALERVRVLRDQARSTLGAVVAGELGEGASAAAVAAADADAGATSSSVQVDGEGSISADLIGGEGLRAGG